MKKNFNYIILIIFFILMINLHRYIYLGGDDYIYGNFIKDGIQSFCNMHINHYIHTNGRAIMHFLVTIMLIFDRYLWIIINPLALCIFVILISKICCKEEKNFNIALLLTIMLLFFIGIDISRETIFWLDGSFNYFYPMLLLLTNIYLSSKVLNENKSYWWLPIIGFLSGATVEQAGLMTIGILFLLIVDKVIIKKQKACPIYYINLVTTLIGYLTVILAPGNRVRSSINEPNIIYNIIEIMRLNFMSDNIQIYIILLMVSIILWLYKLLEVGCRYKLNKILIILMYINLIIYSFITVFTKFITLMANRFISDKILITDSIYELTSLVLDFIYRININNLFAMIIFLIILVSSLFTVSMLIYVAIYLYIKKGEIRFISFLIVALGAQLMMIVSPVFGFRTVFPSLVASLVIIIISLIENLDNKYTLPFIFISVMISTSNIYLFVFSVGIFILYIIDKYNYKNMCSRVMCALLVIVSLLIFNKNIYGYKENSVIHRYNLNKIKEYKSNNEIGKLVLKKLPNDKYRYIMIYESEFHESYFKKYYDIPQDTSIIFE